MRYNTVAELSLWVDEIMAEICQVVAVNYYNGVIEQITRRKHNLLLESVLNAKETRNIVDATSQGLESEEKVKETTLLRIVGTKTRKVKRKENSRCYINMSKLAKTLNVEKVEDMK